MIAPIDRVDGPGPFLEPSSRTQRGSIRRLLHVLGLAGSMAIAVPAAAQDVAGAEALFNRGLADMKEGRYEAGCKAIAESQRLDPRPGTLFTLAVCESRWGRVATAMTRFGDYLALYERLSPDLQARQGERPKVAREERTKLAAEVPELTLSLPPGAPAGTVVKRDGVVLGAAALGVGLPVDPGQYVVSTTAPGGAAWEQQITIGKGEKKQVTLEVKAASASTTSDPSNEQSGAAPTGARLPGGDEGGGGQRTAAYVVGGIGIAGLVLGGVTGALALKEKGVIDDHCGSAIQSNDPTACDQEGLDAADQVGTFGLVSTIGFGVGLAGVGAAVVLLLTEPTGAKKDSGSASRWIRAGVFSVTPDGALVGARAVW